MMIFKKSIPRRTFLRGVGATLALPLLDGMIPALAAATPEAAKPATRLGIVHVPNGIIMNMWTPTATGAGFKLTPILEPLAPFQDRLLVLSGLNNLEARQMPGENNGDHPRACTALLTGTHPKMTSGVDLRAGISFDQVAAKELRKHTQLASLELGIESAEVVGSCESAYSCAYYNTISWSSPTTPLPMENNPRAVFERLFGDSDSTDPVERLARIGDNRSILDFVNERVAQLRRGLGPTDHVKLDQYLDAIRDVERRIQLVEEQGSRERPIFERPVGVPAVVSDHVKLMFDLQVLAYQSDLTRVSTFMLGHEMSQQAYPEVGFGDQYHALTHHQGDPVKIAKVIRINTFHMTLFSYFLEKLRSTPDGDGSLLDHSMILYASPLSDGNLHMYKNLPVVLAGGASGQIKSAGHVEFPKETPITNLYLTLLDKLGIHVESLGDSTGTVELL